MDDGYDSKAPAASMPPQQPRREVVRPDFAGGGIVNLMASVRGALSSGEATVCGQESYVPLRGLDAAMLEDARHVVLLVVDGLGHRYLERHARGVLREYLYRRMTTVFPSTTASAVTTFFTGVAPQQHGLTGWFTWVPAAGGVIAPLPFRYRDGAALDERGVSTDLCFHAPPLFPALARQCHVVHPAFLVGTPYNSFHARGATQWGYRDLRGMFAQLHRLLRERAPRRYIHAYWPEFDRIAHDSGVGSAAAARHFRAIERAFGRFVETVRGLGAALLLTADHGFMDTRPASRVSLAAHGALLDMLRLPACGEPRALVCHVKARCEADLAAYVSEALPGCCTAYAADQMLREGWFGLGAPMPGLAARCGDCVLLMHDDYVLDDGRTKDGVHVGEHGGVSVDEMYVPLVAVPP